MHGKVRRMKSTILTSKQGLSLGVWVHFDAWLDQLAQLDWIKPYIWSIIGHLTFMQAFCAQMASNLSLQIDLQIINFTFYAINMT